MIDPVVLSCGNTFERAAITAWLQSHDTSPITGVPRGISARWSPAHPCPRPFYLATHGVLRCTLHRVLRCSLVHCYARCRRSPFGAHPTPRRHAPPTPPVGMRSPLRPIRRAHPTAPIRPPRQASRYVPSSSTRASSRAPKSETSSRRAANGRPRRRPRHVPSRSRPLPRARCRPRPPRARCRPRPPQCHPLLSRSRPLDRRSATREPRRRAAGLSLALLIGAAVRWASSGASSQARCSLAGLGRSGRGRTRDVGDADVPACGACRREALEERSGAFTVSPQRGHCLLLCGED